MTGTLFNFPKKAYFGRVIPKSKFYEHGSVTRRQKDLFVKQVEQIIWLYKLAPETINLRPSEGVPELQIFKLMLKGSELSNDVLRCIDQAVMFPIVFEVESGDKVMLTAAYKRRSASAPEQWVLSDYYSTNWLSSLVNRAELKYSLDLESLYQQILHSLLPYKPRSGESLDDLILRNESISKKKKEIDALMNRLIKEKQFNKKVELNAVIKKEQSEFVKLTA